MKILPCPFCGEEPFIDTAEHFIKCRNLECGCMPHTKYHVSNEKAIEAWNKRVPVTDEYEV